VPLAEFDGKSLTQSLAISRYFARKAKLVPEDPYLAALCDEYVDAVRDMMNVFYPIAILEDEKEKKEKLAEALKTVKPRFLDVFDGIVKANGGKYLVGSLTWADIWLVHALDNFNRVLGVSLTENHENLKNLQEGVMNSERIKAWVDKRPSSQF
jgi:glutathione S-transferase